jgi:hypothetical protein
LFFHNFKQEETNSSSRYGGARGKGGRRTGHFLLSLRNPSLVASGHGSYGFISGCQSDDGKEGEDQPGRGADVPPAEDDTQVVGVPGEEHLGER